MQNVNEPGSIWGALLSDKWRQQHAMRRTARAAHRYAARATAGHVYAWHLARLLLAHLLRTSGA